jgi:hypothetical protein
VWLFPGNLIKNCSLLTLKGIFKFFTPPFLATFLITLAGVLLKGFYLKQRTLKIKKNNVYLMV